MCDFLVLFSIKYFMQVYFPPWGPYSVAGAQTLVSEAAGMLQLKQERHAAYCLLKAPSSPPQHYGSHKDGSGDGAYYQIGGTRTCKGVMGKET